ncbi:hypothetical protein [Ileibacterium valens]|uniref:Phage tail tape measure protein n=1 Tax=Ileibacterium valens TaxID=1862668 RepID=A0A1U7NHX0_9FIRM|nr:hypothetical protein [Ileibacterium valens]OLU40466.1 hypothetical protein BO224_05600 [Erysipelotrichaceae bacterium NYU-BL-E8]OLU41686.1 hypothetical protein BO222_03000 [Ileibacterium valens]OLU42890.1 hypothetical protein BM735_01485 [Erysipelotrichaceae bacterium NYU-BL-F16]
MAENTIGQAYVQIVPSAKGIKGALAQQFDGEGTAIADSLMSKIKGALAAAGIGAAIGAAFKTALSESAKLEQSLGGIDTLFKGSADTVKAYARNAFKDAGVSANEYMENVTSFSASLISSCGNDTAKAAETANRAMIDMSDNANKMGSNMADIQNAYQGFAKQNYTINLMSAMPVMA